MTGLPWLIGTGVLLLAWSYYLDARHGFERRLAQWYLDRARTAWGRNTGPVCLLLSLLAALAYGTLLFVAGQIGTSTSERVLTMCVMGAPTAAYAPFVLATAPVQTSAYRVWRAVLAEAGASPQEQRTIAWWAGPPSVFGMVLIIVGLVAFFIT